MTLCTDLHRIAFGEPLQKDSRSTQVLPHLHHFRIQFDRDKQEGADDLVFPNQLQTCDHPRDKSTATYFLRVPARRIAPSQKSNYLVKTSAPAYAFEEMADLASRITKPEEPAAAAAAPAPAGETKTDDEDLVQENLVDATYDVEIELSDLQNQEGNPLHSVKSFEELGLPKSINDGLLAMNFRKPSKVQETALPLMLSDPPRNMIAQSQSGTGKTAAFVLTCLTRVDLDQRTTPQALLLAPSRELARQIQGVILSIGQFCPNLTVVAAIPGAVARDAKIEGSIVVGTPGTVIDLIRRKQFDTRHIKVLVIDEADNMLDMQGLGDQCVRLKRLIPPTTQILLFSATFPDKVMSFAQKYAPNANSMRLRHNDLTVKGISQMYMDCPDQNKKYDILCKLYGLMTIGSSVIFVKTRESADEIKKRMEADGHKVSVLHGAYEGVDRDTLLDDFRSGRSKVLITTNVLARGIDVSTVSMVINYDIPMKGPGDREPDAETYLHRIGRTGRFGRVGVSISFVYDRKSYQALTTISNFYGIDLVQLSPDDWDETEKKVQQILKSSRAKPDYAPKSIQV